MNHNVQAPAAIEQGNIIQKLANANRHFVPVSLMAAGSILLAACGSGEHKTASADGTPAPSASPSVESCAPVYTMTNKVHDVLKHRPMGNGVHNADGTLSYDAAVAKKQTKSAINTDAFSLVNVSQGIQQEFSDSIGTAKITLEKVAAPIKNEPTSLCLTAFGRDLRTKVDTIYSVSTPTASEAKSTDRNSGLDVHGNLVTAATPGISGDRHSVVYTTPDGRSFEQMDRCGNIVNVAPNTPIGPTDQPPETHPSPSPSPSSHSTVPPKHDDGRLPQVPGAAPAEQDPGTPGKPGKGPAGQPVSPIGTVPGEVLPTQASYSPAPRPLPTSNPQPTGNPETGAPQPSTTPVPVVTISPQATATMPPQPN